MTGLNKQAQYRFGPKSHADDDIWPGLAFLNAGLIALGSSRPVSHMQADIM
jgi:hypothetical protein